MHADVEEAATATEAVEDQAVEPAQEATGPLGQEVGDVPDPIPQPAAPQQPSYVYALGQIDARYPTLGVEKEVAQVASLLETHGLHERQVLKKVISDEKNRYLVRQLCWLFLVEGLETYILVPRDPRDYELLASAYREYPGGDDIDAVIGTRGPIAPPDACNGVSVPIVAVDQLYSFERETLLKAIPRPPSVPEDREQQFRQAAGGVFGTIMHMADNAGATDEHRALNYLAVRSPEIYAAAAEAHDRDASLTSVDARPSELSGVRHVVEVVFSFTDRKTDVVDKKFVRVDVTDEYPFLVTKLSPYFDR
jgi:PatG C-terminal